MQYQTKLQPWNEITSEHPAGIFWAYEIVSNGPRNDHKNEWFITDANMANAASGPSYEAEGVTTYISKSWRVAVMDGVVTRLKT